MRNGIVRKTRRGYFFFVEDLSEFETRKVYIYRDWLKGDVIRVNAKMPFRLHFPFFFIGAYDNTLHVGKRVDCDGL